MQLLRRLAALAKVLKELLQTHFIILLTAFKQNILHLLISLKIAKDVERAITQTGIYHKKICFNILDKYYMQVENLSKATQIYLNEKSLFFIYCDETIQKPMWQREKIIFVIKLLKEWLLQYL